MKPDLWELIIEQMKARRELGIQRYSRPLTPYNGRDALIDAREEALDLVAYLTQAIYERDHLEDGVGEPVVD